MVEVFFLGGGGVGEFGFVSFQGLHIHLICFEMCARWFLFFHGYKEGSNYILGSFWEDLSSPVMLDFTGFNVVLKGCIFRSA